MTKDELKCRISMALKDPILQQGFEIICRENAELKDKVSYLEDNLRVARKDRENLLYFQNFQRRVYESR